MSSSQRKRSGKQKPKTPALDALRSSHEITPRRRTFYDGYDVLPSSLTYNPFGQSTLPVVEVEAGQVGPTGPTSSRIDEVARLLASRRSGPLFPAAADGDATVGPSAVGPSAVGPTPRFRNVPDDDDDIDTIVDNLSGMTTRREWGGDDDDDGPGGPGGPGGTVGSRTKTRKNKKRSRKNKRRLRKTKSRKHR